MKTIGRKAKIVVSGDGGGVVCQAGGLLLALRMTGLDRELSRSLERWRGVHDPEKIVADLALGGNCLADVAVLRTSPELFGPVASDPTVSRLVARLAACGPSALRAIRAARAAARRQV